MYLLYVDEAGCTGSLPSVNPHNVQPVFVIAGLIVHQSRVVQLTRDFVALKQQFYPQCCRPAGQPLHWILNEIKGADVRAHAVDPTSRNRRRAANGFLDKTLRILEQADARIIGRVWIKGVGEMINTIAIYTSSIQYLATWFNRYLSGAGEPGAVICDSRTAAQNAQVSHSVFTGKHSQSGDKFPHIIEIPTFGHSQTHAAMQMADILCSALLFPMAAEVYCTGYVTGPHVRPEFSALRARFGTRLEALQYRTIDPSRQPLRARGGITVDDTHGRSAGNARSGALLFR